MILLLEGILTLIYGYKTYRERKTRISGLTLRDGLKYKTVLLPENGAKALGLLLSIWGLVFIFLSVYITFFEQTLHNFFVGFWLLGIFIINISVGLYFRRYSKEELKRH